MENGENVYGDTAYSFFFFLTKIQAETFSVKGLNQGIDGGWEWEAPEGARVLRGGPTPASAACVPLKHVCPISRLLQDTGLSCIFTKFSFAPEVLEKLVGLFFTCLKRKR